MTALSLLPATVIAESQEDDGAIESLHDDIVLWIKADSLVKHADGAPLSAWPNSNGSELEAIQPLERLRPTFHRQVQNGLPAVRFASFDGQTMFVLGMPLPAYSTQFYVFNPTGFGYNPPFFEHGTDVNEHPGSLLYGSIPMFSVRRGPTLAIAVGESDWDYFGNGYSDLDLAFGRTWVIVAATYAPDGPRVRRNGSLQDNREVTGVIAADSVIVDTFHIGSRAQTGFWSHMDLGEVVLVRRPLSDSEIQSVEQHLSRKWDVPLNQ